MIEVTIDGKKTEVPAKTSALLAARRLGIEIPTLCHHDALEPFGACRLCLVEVCDQGHKSVVAACTYKLEKGGLEIKTQTPEVLRARKMSLKLLLARRPNVGVLKNLAQEWGLESTDLLLVEKSEEKCILCGQCVRVCREVIGKNVIGFVFRGAERRPSTPFDQENPDCLGCAACAFVCPTGAIQVAEKDGQITIAPWHSTLEQVFCAQCGKPVGPSKMVAQLQETLAGEKGALAGEMLCLSCRRKQVARLTATLPVVHF